MADGNPPSSVSHHALNATHFFGTAEIRGTNRSTLQTQPVVRQRDGSTLWRGAGKNTMLVPSETGATGDRRPP